MSDLVDLRPMSEAPTTGPVVEILAATNDRAGCRGWLIVHFADGGGEEQPRFRGWFYWTGYDFREIDGNKLIGWIPLPVIGRAKKPERKRSDSELIQSMEAPPTARRIGRGSAPKRGTPGRNRTIRVPDPLWEKFQAAAAALDLGVTDWLLEAGEFALARVIKSAALQEQPKRLGSNRGRGSAA